MAGPVGAEGGQPRSGKVGARFLECAPLVVVAHVAEEAPGFVDWLNQRVEPELTTSGFWVLNAVGIAVTALLAVAAVHSRDDLLARINHQPSTASADAPAMTGVLENLSLRRTARVRLGPEPLWCQSWQAPPRSRDEPW